MRPQVQELRALAVIVSGHRDIWREQHPNERNSFTVWSEKTNARMSNRGLRIDYVLCNAAMAAKAGPCEILYDLPQVWHQRSIIGTEF
jgi:exonuclease III